MINDVFPADITEILDCQNSDVIERISNLLPAVRLEMFLVERRVRPLSPGNQPEF